MGDFKKIKEKEFDKAYNTHLPSNWIKFAFKYFSTKTENENLTLSKNLQYYLTGLFLVGLLATILKVSAKLIGIITIMFSVVLVGVILYTLSAVILNRIRIKKIRKILGVTEAEYNYLVNKFKK